jgi:sugar lactone lactonase YvrE
MKPIVLVDTLRFPEGPRWHEGKLWCCDYFAQRVINIDLQGNVQAVVSLPDIPSALGWTLEGKLLVVSGTQRKLLKLEESGLEEVADLSDLVSAPCTDMVIDKQGRAYISNMGFDFTNPQDEPKPGPILLVTPEGETRVVADGLMFPNGLVITPDEKTLIVAESYAARLTAFNIASDGSLSHHRVWTQFDDVPFEQGRIVPDGICLDAEGAVWLASPGTREVLRVHEGATITHRISVDHIALACMLGGPERRTLFIATTESQDPRDTNAKGHIQTLEVEVPGAGQP